MTATGTGGIAKIQNVTGGQGADTLAGPDVDTTWTITGANAGAVGAVAFSGFEDLVGGSADDTFKLADGTGVAGTIDGGGGANTLDWSAFQTARNVALTSLGGSHGFDGTEASIGGGFTNIDSLNGTAVAGGSLTGLDAAAAWDLPATGPDTYTSTNTLTFSGFAQLAGGTVSDTFDIAGAQPVSLKGGGGRRLRLRRRGERHRHDRRRRRDQYPGLLRLHHGREGRPRRNGGHRHRRDRQDPERHRRLRVADTLAGPDVDTTWTITDANAGAVGAVAFSGIENLGGARPPTPSSSATRQGRARGTVDGGGGARTRRKSSAYPTAVSSTSRRPPPLGTGGVAGIQTPSGGAHGATRWPARTPTAPGPHRPRRRHRRYPSRFPRFEKLVGARPTTPSSSPSREGVRGTVDGGGGTNTLDYSAYTTAVKVGLADGTATGTGGFAEIQNVPGGGRRHAAGPDADTTWAITGAGAGTVGAVAFAGFEKLVGARPTTPSSSPTPPSSAGPSTAAAGPTPWTSPPTRPP